MYIQWIGVKFINNGPYNHGNTGITYDYYNDRGITLRKLQPGDIVVVETKYGPSIAQVVEVYPTQIVNATCKVLEVCSGNWAKDMRDKWDKEAARKAKKNRIKSVKSNIKAIIGDVASDPIALARFIAGDPTVFKDKQKKLYELLEELDELEPDTGLPF